MNMLAQHVNNTTNPPIGDGGINAKHANGSIPERKTDSIEWLNNTFDPIGGIPKSPRDIPEPEPEPETQSANPNHDPQLAPPEYIGVATRPRVLESKTTPLINPDRPDTRIDLKLRVCIDSQGELRFEFCYFADSLGEDAWLPETMLEQIKHYYKDEMQIEMTNFVKLISTGAIVEKYSPEWVAASQSGVNEN